MTVHPDGPTPWLMGNSRMARRIRTALVLVVPWLLVYVPHVFLPH